MALRSPLRYRTFPLLTVVVATAVGACQSAPSPSESTHSTSQTIRAGTQDAAGNDKSIFLTYHEVTPTTSADGTGFNILYPRCILTAEHHPVSRIYAGVNLQGNLAGKLNQDVDTRIPHPDPHKSRRDLAILWMKALKSEAGNPRLQEADYSKIELKDSMGLTSADLKADGTLNNESAGAPIDVRLIGYGDNDTVMGADTGGSIRRHGDAEARFFIQGSAQTVYPKFQGGFYHIVAKAGAAARAACSGDSGGPVLHDGKAFAVISNSEDVDCNKVTWTRATSLDKGAIPNKKSNWDWVHETAEKTCGKKMGAGKGCDGKVIGTVSPAQSMALDSTLNSEIRVGEDNCFGEEDPTEMVHYGQTITLTATPNPGYQFDHWTGSYCPCEGSSSPTCVASYNDIGFYTETVSIDESFCFALFEQIDPQEPPPPRCCEETGLCMICLDPIDPTSSASSTGDPTTGSGMGGSYTTGVGGAGGVNSSGGDPSSGSGGSNPVGAGGMGGISSSSGDPSSGSGGSNPVGAGGMGGISSSSGDPSSGSGGSNPVGVGGMGGISSSSGQGATAIYDAQ
ncbi:MAG: hypothetical protein IPK82_19740 [Polyangiaceae bacterium]|nr:hypothetical protein [Polyangiaceae bacterium]